MTLVTFIIPVRHQDNASDWNKLKEHLTQTVASISNQTNGDWQGIVVANEGADLPDLPEKFDAVRVTFPPNDMHEFETGSREAVLDAFRADKGRRVLSGMMNAKDSRFFMIVDDDDFVSSRIVQYVSEHQDANGWTIDHGYIWDDGGQLLFGYDDFSHLCGTSLIIRADLYKLPQEFEDASLEWIKSMLGSHVRIANILARRGTPLEELPFRAAIYRVGHGESHSRAPSLLRQYFLNRTALAKPRRWLRDFRKLRVIGKNHKREFFGEKRSKPM
ncbi:galactosyl transferase [Rhizobium sp. Pop5]|uniref:hypothetical protein n=1 Tax=Rhizobium sp. Pop5 TaxID=1223565 RepID=UPI000283AAA8|nr:hypothetical protein [Rhizobium sp. Pop5]EJZ17250.1 galactosyltransferase protein [Rhizobium sp. Pop5]UVD55758.1 galactosyl transferase [Rhizobium sp. Pop5]